MAKGDPLDFWKKYRLIASTKTYTPNQLEERTCRYCGRDENSVPFTMDAHIIPELMGENDILSMEECDECNKTFSSYESHLAIFFRPYLTAVGVKGKKKIPEFHSRTIDNDEDTRMVFKHDDEGKRQLIIGSLEDYKIDEANKRASITFRLPPHKPKYIYKALVKIALSLLPKEKTERYSNLFDWLMGRDTYSDYFTVAFLTVLTGKKFASPFADLYEAKRVMRKASFIPELCLIVNFGNIVIQIFLPLSKEFDYEASNGKSPTLNVYPAFTLNIDFEEAQKTGKVNYYFTTLDLKSEESVSYNNTIHFTFERYDSHSTESGSMLSE